MRPELLNSAELGTAPPSVLRRTAQWWAPLLAFAVTGAFVWIATSAVEMQFASSMSRVFDREVAAAGRLMSTPMNDRVGASWAVTRLWNREGPRPVEAWRTNITTQMQRRQGYLGSVWFGADNRLKLAEVREGLDSEAVIAQLRGLLTERDLGTAGSLEPLTLGPHPVFITWSYFDNGDGQGETLFDLEALDVMAERAVDQLALGDSDLRIRSTNQNTLELTPDAQPLATSTAVLAPLSVGEQVITLKGTPGEEYFLELMNPFSTRPLIWFGLLLTIAASILTLTLVRSQATRRSADVANSQLQEQQAMLSAVLSASPDALIITDTNRIIRMVSDGFERIFGYAPKEALGQSAAMLYESEEEFRKKAAHRDNAVRLNMTERMPAQYQRKNGEVFPGESTVGFVRDEQENVVGFTAIVRDMSVSQSLLERITRSEDLLARTNEIARVGGWSLDLETKHLEWSDEVFRIHELPVGEPPAVEDAINFYAPAARQPIRDAIETAMTRGTPWDLELPLMTAKGNPLWVRALGEPVSENGKPVALRGVFQDLTEIRRLRVQREHLFNQAEDLFAIADKDAALVEVNDSWARTLGWQRNELIGKALTDLVHTNDVETVLQSARMPRGDLESTADDVRLRRANGGFAWVSLVTTAPDTESHIYLVARDISERRAMEEALWRRERELRRSNEDLEHFAYIASHDLNEPLRKVRTFGDRLVATQADKLDDKGKHYVERMQDACRRMGDMIAALLTYSRAGGEFERRPVNLNQLLAAVQDDFQLRILETRANVEVDDLPTVQGDDVRLHQLFCNLVWNAMKYAHPDRAPVIRVRRAQAPSETHHCIEVSDNGIGFEVDHAARIFELFQRLHPKETYEGTGLGLAICKRIVDSHGGEISANARPGEGATFTVKLLKMRSQ